MQLVHVLLAWIGKEGENRESLIRLTQDASRSNGKRYTGSGNSLPIAGAIVASLRNSKDHEMAGSGIRSSRSEFMNV
jgi:hypothetical protein